MVSSSLVKGQVGEKLWIVHIAARPPRNRRRKEPDVTVTPTSLIRAAGAAAVVAGLIFIGVQIGHPHADVTNVTTTEWAIRNSLKVLMAALALAGITGMYLSQVRRNGVLGLVGYLLLAVGYLLIRRRAAARAL
jgi:hypothetical protein